MAEPSTEASGADPPVCSLKHDKKPAAGPADDPPNSSMRKLLLSNFTLKSLFSLASYPNPNQNEAREVIMEVSGASHQLSGGSGSGSGAAVRHSAPGSLHASEPWQLDDAESSGGVRLGLRDDDALLPQSSGTAAEGGPAQPPRGRMGGVGPALTPDRAALRPFAELGGLDVRGSSKSGCALYDGEDDKDLDADNAAKKASPASVSSLRPTAEEFMTKCVGAGYAAKTGFAEAAGVSGTASARPSQGLSLTSVSQPQPQPQVFSFSSHCRSVDSDGSQNTVLSDRSRSLGSSGSTADFADLGLHESRRHRRQGRKAAAKSGAASRGKTAGADVDAEEATLAAEMVVPQLQALRKALRAMPPPGERTWSQHTEACHIERQMADIGGQSKQVPGRAQRAPGGDGFGPGAMDSGLPSATGRQASATEMADGVQTQGRFARASKAARQRYRHVSDVGQSLGGRRVLSLSSVPPPRPSFPVHSASDFGGLESPALAEGAQGAETDGRAAAADVECCVAPVAPTPVAAQAVKFLDVAAAAAAAGGGGLGAVRSGQTPGLAAAATSAPAVGGLALWPSPGVHPTGTHTAPPTVARSLHGQPGHGDQLLMAASRGGLQALSAQIRSHHSSPQHESEQVAMSEHQAAQQMPACGNPLAVRHYYPHPVPAGQDDYCMYCSFEEYNPELQQVRGGINYDYRGQDMGERQMKAAQLRDAYAAEEEQPAFGLAASSTSGSKARPCIPIPDAPWPYGLGVHGSAEMKEALLARAYPLHMGAKEVRVLERQRQSFHEPRQAEIDKALALALTLVDPGTLIPGDMWAAADDRWRGEGESEGEEEGRGDRMLPVGGLDAGWTGHPEAD
ncbi:hypothetical protein BROUX41_001886 [Berkeleyomyces rouxiae]